MVGEVGEDWKYEKEQEAILRTLNSPGMALSSTHMPWPPCHQQKGQDLHPILSHEGTGLPACSLLDSKCLAQYLIQRRCSTLICGRKKERKEGMEEEKKGVNA